MAQVGVKVTFKFSGSALLSTRRSFFTWVPDYTNLDEDCLYSLHSTVDSDKPCCYEQTMHIVCVSWQDMKPAVWCQLMFVPWSICLVLYYWSVYTLLLSSSDICASNWGQAAGRWGQDEVCTHWWWPSHPAECVPCLQTEWVHHILVPPYSSRILLHFLEMKPFVLHLCRPICRKYTWPFAPWIFHLRLVLVYTCI